MAAEVAVGGVAEGEDGVAPALQARGAGRREGLPEPGAVVGGVAVSEGARDQQQVGAGRQRRGVGLVHAAGAAAWPSAVSRSRRGRRELLGVPGLGGPQDHDLAARSVRRRAGPREPPGPSVAGGAASALEYIPASTPFTHSACSGLNGASGRQHRHARDARRDARRGSRPGTGVPVRPGPAAARAPARTERDRTGGMRGELRRDRRASAPDAGAVACAPARARSAHRHRGGHLGQRHRAHLELGLEGQRVDGVAGHRVDAEVLPEQVVPVERRETAARAAPGR